eukprot:gnl/Spiro4/9543_TR5061_c0_g1_i1.p1 gnl/Spiro4/9543_TR5061_c0_g1~~gnl/Spiro4/9543_TR5061_c0_g1_i1.p1  ORF type:complete len:735 (+),score=148.17 gnl/Spiro4/9543_TR5061_c0_g1_i1:40-2244(+)
MTTEGLSIPTLLGFRRVGAFAVNPAGTKIVFALKQLKNQAQPFSSSNAEFATNLYSIDYGLQQQVAPRQLTNGSSDSSPFFFDNDTVGFLSNRSGSSQLWCISLCGGEAIQLTSYAVSIESVKFCARYSFVVFSANAFIDIAPTPDTLDCSARFVETAARLKVDHSNRHLIFNELYVKRWDCLTSPNLYSHLYLQQLHRCGGGGCGDEAAGGIVMAPLQCCGPVLDLMGSLAANCPLPPFGGAEHYDISPAGDAVALTTILPCGSRIAWTTDSNVFVVPLAVTPHPAPSTATAAGLSSGGGGVVVVGAMQKVSASEGYDAQPSFSPDGQRIAYLSMRRAGYEADRNRLMIIAHDSSATAAAATATEVASSFDVSFQTVAWTADCSQLIVTADHQAHHKIFRINITDNSVTCLVDTAANSNPIVVGPSSSSSIVFVRDSFVMPAELFCCNTRDGSNLRALTGVNSRILQTVKMATALDLRFPGALGDSVQAWFMHPSSFSPTSPPAAGTVPLCVMIHGGPQGCMNDHFHYRWNPQILAAAGYAVLIVNFHGSTGFGQAFTDSIHRQWGGLPYEDIMKGLDFALSQFSWLDGSRVAALGGSYGGYMVNWINGHTDRFRCLVCHDGIFNLSSMAYATEELFFTEWEFGVPFESLQGCEQWSPHNHVNNWKTPCLVIHGGKDFRCPENEGIATFTALQRRGIKSRYLLFPSEGHWVLNPINSATWNSEVLLWLKENMA